MSREFSEVWCYETLRQTRWPGGVVCPYCRRARTTSHSKSSSTPRRRYFCRLCRRTFTDTTGTLLAHSNLPLALWFTCLLRSRYRETPGDLARVIGVKWETAAQLQHRVAMALARPGLFRRLREAAERAEGPPAMPAADSAPRAPTLDAMPSTMAWPPRREQRTRPDTVAR